MDSILAGDFLGSFFQNSHKRYGFNSDRQPPAKLRSEFEKFMGSMLTGNSLRSLCQNANKSVDSMLAGNVLDKLCQNSQIVGSTLTRHFLGSLSHNQIKNDSMSGRNFFRVQKLLNSFRKNEFRKCCNHRNAYLGDACVYMCAHTCILLMGLRVGTSHGIGSRRARSIIVQLLPEKNLKYA